MFFKNFAKILQLITSISLVVILIIGAITTNTQIAYAGIKASAPCTGNRVWCIIIGEGGNHWPPSIPPPEPPSLELPALTPIRIIAKSQTKIEQETEIVDDHLILGYVFQQLGDYPLSKAHYSQALELAVKNKDIEGQAIAGNNLGEVYLKMGNLKEAVSQLTLARDMYQSLGNEQRVSEVNQRLAGIERLLQVNPYGSQIDPSQLQLDLSRIQLERE
ncbi:MAG: tetratricopeptide repeat protein [Coleofasciculaceae cyanobacterium]